MLAGGGFILAATNRGLDGIAHRLVAHRSLGLGLGLGGFYLGGPANDVADLESIQLLVADIGKPVHRFGRCRRSIRSHRFVPCLFASDFRFRIFRTGLRNRFLTWGLNRSAFLIRGGLGYIHRSKDRFGHACGDLGCGFRGFLQTVGFRLGLIHIDFLDDAGTRVLLALGLQLSLHALPLLAPTGLLLDFGFFFALLRLESGHGHLGQRSGLLDHHHIGFGGHRFLFLGDLLLGRLLLFLRLGFLFRLGPIQRFEGSDMLQLIGIQAMGFGIILPRQLSLALKNRVHPIDIPVLDHAHMALDLNLHLLQKVHDLLAVDTVMATQFVDPQLPRQNQLPPALPQQA